MMKKHMVPLSKGGALHNHVGKGSQMTSMPNRQEMAGFAAPGASMGNFAKATPMAAPSPDNPPRMPVSPGGYPGV